MTEGRPYAACSHCGTAIALPTATPTGDTGYSLADLRDFTAETVGPSPAATGRCRDCRARVEWFQPLEQAPCPYCLGTMQADDPVDAVRQPQGILPSTVSKSRAAAAIRDTLGSLARVPGQDAYRSAPDLTLFRAYVPF